MSVGDVGLAIGQVGIMTELVQSVIRYWAELESNMTSVERTLEYTAVKVESEAGKDEDKWPKGGEISFKDVNLCYGSAKIPVLKNVSFNVGEKQRIGVVGRTGAGKSSIISTIYRLYNFDGVIEIDDVDTKTLSLSYLR